MALIQDIQPPAPRRRLPTQAVERRIKEVHQATNIPKLVQASQQRVSSFDILAPTRPIPTTPTKRPARPVSPSPRSKIKTNTRPKLSQKTKISFWRQTVDYMQYPIIAVVALGSAYSSIVGQIIILLFLIASLTFKLSSRISFVIAIVLLASIPFFQAIKQTGVAQNSAIYAYEMLVVGTVIALFELWKDSRKKPASSRLSTEGR
jgi:hypothetical protein